MSTLESLVDQARSMLADELGIDSTAITVESVEDVEWPSSALGCPQPDHMYLTVITPGYRIVLAGNGRRYEFHTDQGSRVIRCDP